MNFKFFLSFNFKELRSQLFNLFKDSLKGFLSRWEQDYKEASTSSNSSAQNLKSELREIEEKQQRLLYAYLDQTITNEEYTATKNKLMNRKVELKELADFWQKDTAWLELFKEWILSAHQARSYADTGNLEEKRSFLQKIGSNFHIIGQKAAVELGFPWAAAVKKLEFSVWSR